MADYLKRCAECRWNYPEELLSPLVINARREEMCPICALEKINQQYTPTTKHVNVNMTTGRVRDLTGKRATFSNGSQAERMRLDAVAWRKAHPEHAMPVS